MANVKWTIKGREFINCNCAYGCPCQFNALPTHGSCEAVGGFQIDEGHHYGTRLDGLKFVGLFRWPGPIHEGRGEAAVVVDERATPEQRNALLRIVTGRTPNRARRCFRSFPPPSKNCTSRFSHRLNSTSMSMRAARGSWCPALPRGAASRSSIR